MHRSVWKVNGQRVDIVEYTPEDYYIHFYNDDGELEEIEGIYEKEYDAVQQLYKIYGNDTPVEFVSEYGERAS